MFGFSTMMARPLAPFPVGVRHADDGALRHRRVLVERLFDFDRIGVFAARDEHVFDAIHDDVFAHRSIANHARAMNGAPTNRSHYQYF